VVAAVAALLLIVSATVTLPQPGAPPVVRPQDAWTCPATLPIKGNFTLADPPQVCIYHVQGGGYYDETKP
jgi:hypothetical protein